MTKTFLKLTAASVALCAGLSAANAETLRWARAGDSLTLDPHAQNEGPTHALAHQMYEPLLQRDMDRQIIPGARDQLGADRRPERMGIQAA